MKVAKNTARSYSLAQSAEKVGKIVPIILAADKRTVIDGLHRQAIDPNWPKTVDSTAKTPLDIARKRLVANLHRRTLSRTQKEAELDSFITELRKNRPELQGTLVEEIANSTGFTPRWVYKYLPAKYKSKEGRPKLEQRSYFDSRPWITEFKRSLTEEGFTVADPNEPSNEEVAKFLELLQLEDSRDFLEELIYVLAPTKPTKKSAP